MGLLSGLAKLGGFALAPFTGGASIGIGNAIGTGLDAFGEVAGGGAKSAADARLSQAQIQARIDAMNNRAMLDAGEFNMGAPGARTSQVARGDVLSTMQDAGPTGDARIDKFGTGGLRPSAFGPDSRQAGEELKRQALLALMSGSDRITPRQSSIPKSGFLEKAGGILGTLGAFAGAGREAGLFGGQGTPQVATMKRPPSPWDTVEFG